MRYQYILRNAKQNNNKNNNKNSNAKQNNNKNNNQNYSLRKFVSHLCLNVEAFPRLKTYNILHISTYM